MIAYAEALAEIAKLAAARPLESERVPLAACLGRITAGEVVGSESIPSLDNSSMDGFAIDAAATTQASAQHPARFRVIGTVTAGAPAFREVRAPNEAVEIMTGAPVPAGSLNAVAKVEDVRLQRTAEAVEIEVVRPYAAGENIRYRGSDFAAGQRVVAAGMRLLPEHVLALAATGNAEVGVRRAPRVALISTGNELVDASAAVLPPGMIRNATLPYLLSALPLFGASVDLVVQIPDEPQRFVDRVAELLARPAETRPDVFLSTGAVSMGKHDFIPEALGKLGAVIRFHRVAVQPGRPILAAEWPFSAGSASPVFFGIPGNPISTAVGLRFFLVPFLRAISGQQIERALRLPLSKDAAKTAGLRSFFKACVEIDRGKANVTVLPGQASFMVSPLLRANAWAVLPEAPASVAAGTEVEVFPLYLADDALGGAR